MYIITTAANTARAATPTATAVAAITAGIAAVTASEVKETEIKAVAAQSSWK